ncbi:MAG: multiheme c-type cytochrome, partial [Burkholderiales bacterium]
MLFGLPGCEKAPELADKLGQVQQSDQVESFLEAFWARPLRAQGTPPAHFGPLEAALDPNACGTCHVAQLNDWRGSLHARAMGPGIAGQLANLKSSDRNQHQECLRCHAPLAEQAESLAAALASPHGLPDASQVTPQALHQHGVLCAACHVRGYRWYGPPRRDGSQAADPNLLPHGGWISSAA